MWAAIVRDRGVTRLALTHRAGGFLVCGFQKKAPTRGAWVVVVISHFPLARSARQRTRPLHRRGWDRAPPPANAYPALSSIAKAVKVVSAPLSVFVKADFTLRFICERLRPQHGDPALISIKREVGPSHLGSRWVA